MVPYFLTAIFVVVLLLVFTNRYRKSKGSIVVNIKYGLANRLRALVGFIYVARHTNKKLKIYWEKDSACNEYYSNLFQSHPEFVVIETDDVPLYIMKNAKTTNTIIKSYLGKDHKIDTTEVNKIRCTLKPIKTIQDEIHNFSSKHKIVDRIGLHIRKTDLAIKYKDNKEMQFDFHEYIQNNPDEQFFLATDNRVTQQEYIKKYPKQIVVYKEIAIPTEELVGNARHTPISDALVDIELLARCKKIVKTPGSSYSEYADAKHTCFDLKNFD